MSVAPLLLVLAGLAAQDPVRVQAALSRSEIRVGETTVLRVDVQTDGPRAEIARITRLPPGIELASTRDYDQRQFSLPGGTRRFVSREFVLRAKAAGQFRIPTLEVVVSGRSYTTASQVLTVSPPPPGLRPPSAGVGPESEVALHAWLGSDTAYVGEQVTMRAEAMFSQTARLRLRRAPEYEAPSPSGFWIDDLPDRRGATTRVVDNRVYEVQEFRRAYFPLSPGLHVIPPARLEYEMRRGILYAPETFELTSDSLRLVVLPVPEAGRPAEFTGAVGRFTATGSVEPREVPAGEAVVLTMEVVGVGNMKALPPPRLPELDGVEVFPPSEDAETEITNGVVGGRKTFSWVLIPGEPGRLDIPPLRYAFFDPDAREFGFAEVPGATLTVTPGGGAVAAPAPATTLRYLKTRPAPRPLSWVRTPWFALAQILPLLAIAAGMAAGRPRGASRRELRRRRRSRIRDFERLAGTDDPRFLAELDAFARGWIADRTGVRAAEAGSVDALARVGVPAGTASAVARVLEGIASARYAPRPPARGARESAVRALGAALEQLDRRTPGPSGTGPAPAADASAGARAGILILALSASAPGFAAAQGEIGATPAEPVDAPAADPFAAGLARFDAGEFDAAAELFESHIRSHPDDPAGWYNLGTSYYRAGHPGFAVWAWLHALPLDPRDADTRHNLDVATVRPELVRRVAPAMPLRSAELALLASAAWLIAGAAGGTWLARRRRRGGTSARGLDGCGVVAAVALVLAIGLGALWLASTRDRETLIVLETATLRAGPALGGEPIEDLEPGSGLVPVAPYGDWVRVRTLDGREGWIENRSVGAL